MSHADDTIQRWHEVCWMEEVTLCWEAFFSSLIDEPLRAEALCALGMPIVRGECDEFPQSANPQWMAFFKSLAGRTETARLLCNLGLELVHGQLPTDRTPRSQALALLQTLRVKSRVG